MKDWWSKQTPAGRYITNFRKENYGLYIQAIELSGFDNLEVHQHPNPDSTPIEPEQFFSLFYRGRHPDLAEFWKVFRNLETLVK